MTAVVERLAREHALFGARLSALQSALRFWPDSEWIVRDLAFGLWKQLCAHQQREVDLATRCFLAVGRCGSEELDRLAIEHVATHRQLRLIKRRLIRDVRQSRGRLSSLADHCREQWQREAHQQEARLFPLFACILQLNAKPNLSSRPKPKLSGQMPLSEVVAAYPETGRFFEQCAIDPGAAADCSLDEVAWRCGFDIRWLLEALDTLIAPAQVSHGTPLVSEASLV